MNVPPLSGMRPTRANDCTNVAAVEANTMSQAKATFAPAPAAVHRRDHWLLEQSNRSHHRVVALADDFTEVRPLALARHRFRQILAGAEGASGAGEYDSAQRGVVSHPVECLAQVPRHGSREAVEHVRPVQRDRCHAGRLLEHDVLHPTLDSGIHSVRLAWEDSHGHAGGEDTSRYNAGPSAPLWADYNA